MAEPSARSRLHAITRGFIFPRISSINPILSYLPKTRSHAVAETDSCLTMDFDYSTTKLIPQEFLAIVLAGFGNELVLNERRLYL